MTDIRTALQAKLAEMQARCEDPEYQARIDALAAADHERQAVQAESRYRMFLAQSGIPRAYWDKLNLPDETEAIKAVRELMEGHGPSLVILAGPKGRGKTMALAYAAAQKRGRFVEAQDLFRLSSFAAGDWLDLQECPFLALDEAGCEFLGEVLQVNLFSVLNARLQNLRPTAIATNLSTTDFKARFLRGAMERLEDRVRAYGKWVSLPGESMRQHWSEAHP